MYGAVSGMSAQSNSLSAISDNITNASTVGYKDASTEFSDLLTNVGKNAYSSGGVKTSVQYDVAQQGVLEAASSTTDLAIQNNGFFLVNDASGGTYLTRAGAFTANADGTLTNAAGFTLMGYSLTADNATTPADGVPGLIPVNVTAESLQATASTTGTLTANLPSTASSLATSTTLPSTNASGATYSEKTSLVTYDSLGNPVTLDIYLTNTTASGSTTPTWEMDIYNAADAGTSSTTSSFPYSTSNAADGDTPLLYSGTLSFNSTGALTGTAASGTTYTTNLGTSQPSTATSIAVDIPNTVGDTQTLTLDLSGMTQLASNFNVTAHTTNGQAPSSVTGVTVNTGGILAATYANGTTKNLFQIPLGTVASVNQLTPLTGNVYTTNSESGIINVGTANENGYGTINSQELESSTVDIATELTNMIVAQRGYEANSKVFQTGSDLLSMLNNTLK